jgi:hypothetical protein
MQLYVDAQNGTDTAGQGTSWATAYATPKFAFEDLWTSHGRDSATDANGDTINCFGIFTFATTPAPSVSPDPNQSRRVTFLSRGRNAIDDGLRCEWKGEAGGVWNSSTIEYVGWIGFYFTFGLTDTTPLDKCVRVDRACWFHDCIFDGRGVVDQSMGQFHWNNQITSCQFINMYSSVGSLSIGGQFINCFSSAAAGRAACGFSTYRNGITANCVVVMRNTNASYGYTMFTGNAGGVIYGNTGINIGVKGSGSCGIKGQTETSLIAEIYVQNATSAMSLTSANWFYKNNYYHDCSYGQTSSGSNNILGNFTTLTELTNPMYADPANGDWTITNPEALARRAMPYGGVEYWGGVQQIQAQKNSYNPFGGR